METTQFVITLVSAILGSGGISAVLTALLSAKKFRAEARNIEQETENRMNEYIRVQLKELSETHKSESDELRKQNKELYEQVNLLNNKINQLMTWIVLDNNSYRIWLENELRKLKPDIEFPKCKPAPGFEEHMPQQQVSIPSSTAAESEN